MADAGRDERGQSLSLLFMVVLGSLFLLAGLVIDGGQQVSATRRAEAVAGAAARVGADAAASSVVAGAGPGEAAPLAHRAATDYLAASPEVQGEVIVSGGVVQVRTSSTEPTLFLSLLRITTVTGRGSAEAELFTVGG